MSKVDFIAATAENVAVAYVAAQQAGENLSTAKFEAVLNLAGSVALRLRIEHLDTGKALERNKKGDFIAVADLSKAQRDAFANAFVKAGIGEKDAANIASMGRTIARVFVPRMVETTALHAAKSGDEMTAFIREALNEATGGQETYNALEKARARGWEAPEEDAPQSQGDDGQEGDDGQGDDGPSLDMSAELTSSPIPEGPALTPSDMLDEVVSNALQALREAVARDDWDRLNAHGFGSFLTEAREAHKAFVEANAEAEAAING